MRVSVGVMGLVAIVIGVGACGRSNKASQAEPSPASSAAPNAIYMKYDGVEGESHDPRHPEKLQESTAFNVQKPTSYPKLTQSDAGTKLFKPAPTVTAYPTQKP